MNNKRGFTLIEIIVAIALITVIGTVSVVSITTINKEKELNVLEDNRSYFDNALQVYLSNNKSIIDNVNNNVKAAVVSLELLKNEGLIKDDLDIDYKNNYYTLANAVFLNAGEECKDQVEIKTFASWDIDKNSSEVIYICPRNNGADNDSLISRIEILENMVFVKNSGLFSYVLFDVSADTSEVVSWANDNYEDAWLVVATDNSIGEYKLLYNQNIITDNSKITGKNYYTNDGWSYPEAFQNKYNTANSKKSILYNHINDKLRDNILEKDYYYDYGDSFNNSSKKVNINITYNDKFGTVSTEDDYNEIKNYIGNMSFMIGGIIRNSENDSFLKLKESGIVLGNYATKKTYNYNYVNGNNYLSDLYTPVITISNSIIVANYNNYTHNYKNTHNNCSQEKLGSKDCPYLIKFTNNDGSIIYSDGTKG